MSQRKTTPPDQVTPLLLKFREKRKWQIALRRYVLESNKCVSYAPYFGLDIKNIRIWFEVQFSDGLTWDDFGGKWQFGHVIPVTYFDFSKEDELKMCWNFTNLRMEEHQRNKDQGNRLDVLAAKSYFKELYDNTLYTPCLKLLEKIDRIELSEPVNSKPQQDFIKENRKFLEMIEDYSAFEFELLNSGRSMEEVIKEIGFFKKLAK